MSGRELQRAAAAFPSDLPGSFTMWRYRELLGVADGPVRYPVPVGGTPLLPAPASGRRWARSVDQGRDAQPDRVQQGPRHRPGDRGRAAARSGDDHDRLHRQRGRGHRVCAAAAGMRAVIFVSTACQPGKLALMTQAGAWVFQVREGYAAAVDLSRAAAHTFGWLDRNTGANPLTLEAKKTVAFEVWEQLGRRVPDLMIAPVGDGPTLVALDRGFAELVSRGLTGRQPRLVGVQADACQPLVRAWLGASAGPAELDPAATVADGIAVVRPAIGDAVLEAVGRGGGGMLAVSDGALLRAVATLARMAGVGAEPAGAAALAGLEPAVERACGPVRDRGAAGHRPGEGGRGAGRPGPGRGRGHPRRGRAGADGRPLTVTRPSAAAPRTARG
jgi:threonine synthase